MPFMLSERSRAAVVEIMFDKNGAKHSASNPRMYGNIAWALGIRHHAVVGKVSASAACSQYRDPLSCNLTVSSAAASAMLAAQSTSAHSPPCMCLASATVSACVSIDERASSAS